MEDLQVKNLLILKFTTARLKSPEKTHCIQLSQQTDSWTLICMVRNVWFP